LQNVAKDLAHTLANLHAAHIAHGDFKSDNVLVTQDGRIHVADPLGNGIGCTVFFSENHGGTPGYWAPEVHAGQPISQAGDVYSYGATLYELITGFRPQDGQRLDENIEGFTSAPKISEIICACCQDDPSERPSMKEVLRILGGEQWTNIQIERKQRQELLTAACALGGLILLGALLIGGKPKWLHA
jgi:serine/threonine protein kinase